MLDLNCLKNNYVPLLMRAALVKVHQGDVRWTRVLSNLTMPELRWLMALISEHLTRINDGVASRVDEFTRVDRVNS